jgi:hypothetical protein
MKIQLAVPKMFQELRLSVLHLFFKEKFRESFHAFVKRISEEKTGIDLLKSCLDFLYESRICEPSMDTLRNILRTMPEDRAVEKLEKIAAEDDMSDQEIIKILCDTDQHNTFLFV